MVTGAAAVIAGAEEDGGARRERGLEREGEGEEVPKDGELTRSTSSRSERGGELRNGGNGARTPAAEAERNGTMAAIAGLPARFLRRGGTRGARRVLWRCRRELGRPESSAGATAEASGGGGQSWS